MGVQKSISVFSLNYKQTSDLKNLSVCWRECCLGGDGASLHFLFISKIRMTLHIGEPSDCGVWFPSSGENLAFRCAHLCMYV